MPTLSLAFFGLYVLVLTLLSGYGLHRAHLVWLCWRHRKRASELRRGGLPSTDPETWPRVTVQLPLFNEATVVDRLLGAVAQLDYPRQLLEVQVLDDSTDETRGLVDRAIVRLRSQGIDATCLRRRQRTGYKAGALDAGLGVAKGELVAIFDADFVPPPGFLLQLIEEFADPGVGLVQARWDHLNRDHSLLTRVQALMLDGHHLVENRARFLSGRLFNFSGTAGIWRTAAIASAGGWQHDTITEDLDLSYRAQLAGWRFVYREDVVAPAELPEEISVLRAQQQRWAKGTVQTARKLLRRVLTSQLTIAQRIEAVFHLTPHFAYPLMLLLTLMLLPALLLWPADDAMTMLLFDLPLGLGTTGSLAAFYRLAERAQGGSTWAALRRLPALIALGMGMSPHLTHGVVDGLQRMAGEFVRTPKIGAGARRYGVRGELPLIEATLCVYSLISVAAALLTGHWIAAPFAGLFAFGFGYVSVLLTREALARRRHHLHQPARISPANPSAPTAGPGDAVARQV